MKQFPPISKVFTRTIASREYELVSEDGVVAVVIEIGEPANDVETVTGMDWRCPVRIRYGDETIDGYACGVDSFQTLRGALNTLVPVKLQTIAEENKAKILFLGEECDFDDMNI